MPVGPDFIRAPGPFLSREYSKGTNHFFKQ